MEHNPYLNLPIEQFAVPDELKLHYRVTPTIRSVSNVGANIHVRYEYCFNIWNDVWTKTDNGWVVLNSKIEE